MNHDQSVRSGHDDTNFWLGLLSAFVISVGLWGIISAVVVFYIGWPAFPISPSLLLTPIFIAGVLAALVAFIFAGGDW